MQIISEFVWKKNSRSVNEDSLCICHVLSNGKPLVLGAVCDGVGGMPDGESASNYVINRLKCTFNNLSLDRIRSVRSLSHQLTRCLYTCHEEITSGATTVSLCLTYNNRCIIMSYGDSRVYIGRNKLKQITKDHSDASGHLTQAIGTGNFRKPFIKSLYIRPNTVIIICSDGFYRKNHTALTQNNFFLSYKTESEWKNKLEEMYFNAVNQGEKDNSSAIALKFVK